MLWERGAGNISSTTDAASASVSTGKGSLSGEQSGSASHQSKSLSKGRLVWKHADNVSAASDVADGLYSSWGNMSDPTTEGTDAPQTKSSPSSSDRHLAEHSESVPNLLPTQGENNSSTVSVDKGSEKSPITSELGEKVRLSDEVDENGRQFELTPKREFEFGVIDDKSGLTPAPILFSEGLITNPATNDEYSLVHIEARHGGQIRKAGINPCLNS